ncbi:MAG: outer membrane beta-barrel protein [Candidatus Omnitrophica bacterium]|nr:outer membrane beta-barrel protein [Candidatus Omnitrophota bacterium]
MKRRLIPAAACFFLLIVSISAEGMDRITPEIGTEVSYIKYEEPGFMEEDGLMYGIAGAADYNVERHERLLLRGEGRLAYGQVDYTSAETGSVDSIDDYILELRGLGGYDFLPSRTTVVTPYIGVGYRYLNDDSGGMTTTTGHKGYERESNYFYSPVGMKATARFENDWSLGATVEYDHFWRGFQKSHLSDVNLGFNDVENTQTGGYGLRGSLRFARLGERIDLIIEPFARYWNIRKSKESDVTFAGVIIGRGYEPKNNSIEYGVKVGVGF